MTARGYHIWAPVLGLAALAGCQNTWMLLHVRAPGDADLSDTNVRLIRDGEPVCGGGLLYFGRPDPAGKLRIHTPACGEMRLVVTRPGRSTMVRELDTCEVKSLDVSLDAVHAARVESGSCEAVVSDFMSAWIDADNERARSFWLMPEAYEPYSRNATGAKPWAVDFASSALDGRTCRVVVTEYFETGCDLGWQIELEHSNDRGWGVHTLRQRRLPS